MKLTLLAMIGAGQILLVLFIAIAILVLIFILIRKAITGKSVQTKLKEAKKMFDANLISEQEYETMKARIINENRM